MIWEAYAIRYGRHERPAQSNFLLPVQDPHEAMPLDYYVWLLRAPDGHEIVVEEMSGDVQDVWSVVQNADG